MEQHPFHLVNISLWPFIFSILLLNVVLIIVRFLWEDYQFPCVLCSYLDLVFLIIIIITVVSWFNNIIIEATFEGNHTKPVQRGLRVGMVLFIVSEVMLFIAFFWGFFHSSIFPSIWIGGIWPPQFMIDLCLKPHVLPLINTLILISSGVSVTWAHRALVANPVLFEKTNQELRNSRRELRGSIIFGLFVTIALGFIFTTIQIHEYTHAAFDFSDSIYASLFYSLTGLHGLHVFVGTIFLMVALKRVVRHHFTRQHHFNLEAAIWYWHFVDVVWLFLFIVIYCWPFI